MIHKKVRNTFLAVLIICGVFVIIWPYIQTIRHEGETISFSFEKELLNNAAINIKYQGFDKNNRKYKLTSKKAIELDDHTIQFDAPKIMIHVANDILYTMTADQGIYNKTNNTAKLTSNVRLLNNKDFSMKTDVIHLNFKNGTAENDVDVVAENNRSTIRAVGFKIESTTGHVVFKGRPKIELRKK